MFHDCDDCKHHDRITNFDITTCKFCDYEEGYELGYGAPTGWAPKEEVKNNGNRNSLSNTQTVHNNLHQV